MTKEQRQQSLINARRAAKWLREYFNDFHNDPFEQEVTCVLNGFELLDTATRRPKAGRPRIENPKRKSLNQRRWRDKQKLKLQ